MIIPKVKTTKSLSNVGNLQKEFSDFLINLIMKFCLTKKNKNMIQIKAFKNQWKNQRK